MKRRISPAALEVLQSYSFPGNVRELKSLLKKAVIMSDQEILDDIIISSVGEGSEPIGRWLLKRQDHKSLSEGIDRVEREILEQALGKFKSTRQLARYLGISQPTVVRKLKKYGLSSR